MAQDPAARDFGIDDPSAAAREAAATLLAATGGEPFDVAVVLGSGECTINSYELPDANPPAYVMTPQDKPEYLFIVNGFDAENQRLDLPVCE